MVYRGEFDRAISDWNKALEINPELAEPYCCLGATWIKMAEFDRAISDCNKAIEINPKYVEAYKNRGVAYYFKEQYSKAWIDVFKVQSLGGQVSPGFIKSLCKASGKQNKICQQIE